MAGRPFPKHANSDSSDDGSSTSGESSGASRNDGKGGAQANGYPGRIARDDDEEDKSSEEEDEEEEEEDEDEFDDEDVAVSDRSVASDFEDDDEDDTSEDDCFDPGRTSLPPRINIAYAKKNKDVLLLVAKRLGWDTRKRGCCTVVWVVTKDDMVRRLRKLRPKERLSHLPGMEQMCGKVLLARALQAKRVDFWPRSWCIPEQSLETISEEAFVQESITVVVKPDMGSHGDGIALARRQEDLCKINERMPEKRAVVQEYIQNPLLLGGKKWDARVYVLVLALPTGGLKAYLAREGLVRVCLENYETPSSRNLHRLSAHLTNYSFSKLSDKFVFNDDPGDATSGCKRTLSAVLERLELESLSKITAAETWQSVRNLVLQTVDAIAKPLREVAEVGLSPETVEHIRKKQDQCFQILGFDILLEETGKLWLLEVNNNPSLSLDEVRPIAGAQSRAEANQLFAAAKKNRRFGDSKLGQPCRCSQHPRPHAHFQNSVDTTVKVPVVQGALEIVRRATQDAAARMDLQSCRRFRRANTIDVSNILDSSPDYASFADGTCYWAL